MQVEEKDRVLRQMRSQQKTFQNVLKQKKPNAYYPEIETPEDREERLNNKIQELKLELANATDRYKSTREELDR